MAKVILVTGGAGYVGSHACKALAQAGYVPVTLDNMAYGHEWAVRWGPLEPGDILDRQRLDEVFQKHRPEAVMHFAGFAYVGESVENPGKYYRNNVAGTITLLEAMRDHAVKRIVFSSSCATYGVPQQVPIAESHPQNPINPYGASKLMAERMLDDFGRAHGIGSMCLRYFNAAGADPDAETGEDHDPETHLIPLVLYAASGRRPSIAIFGTDYPTPDGTCIRDYIHVSDLATAHVMALRSLEQGAQSGKFNLGTGQGHSVMEVLAVARRVTGRAIQAEVMPRRPGDPPRLVADATRAAAELGWKPAHASLETQIQHAWNWLLARTKR
jgi:UDP-arabinose 4-epimerase